MSVGVVNKQTGDRIPTAGMPAIDSVLSGSSTNPVQNRVVKAALDEKSDTDIVASDFDATASYTAGNYCIYEGKFYRFKNNHSGAWAAADVDSITVTGELKGKQDIFERISYADWQLLTPQQQAAKPYYIYDYPSTQITAANVSYDHTQSGLSATTAQGGIDELASEKQDATDNNLTTTNKTIVGGINEIKSGLMNLVEVKNGTETVTGEEGAWVYLYVTFYTPFKNKPLVTVNTYDTGSGNNWWPPMLKDITKNGFTAGWYNATGTKNIIWQAIGIKDNAQ